MNLEQFRSQHQLSFAELATLAGGPAAGANRTAVRSVWLGLAPGKLVERLLPGLESGLRTFLQNRGLTASAVQGQLEKIRAAITAAHQENSQSGKEFTMLAPTFLPYEVLHKFGLTHHPFEMAISNQEIFTSPELDWIFQSAVRAIEIKGFCAVLGPTGSGKTVMQQRLAEYTSDPARKIKVISIDCPELQSVTSYSVSGYILEAFDQKVPRDKLSRSNKIKKTLHSATNSGWRILLSIDDCHNASGYLMLSLKKFNEYGHFGKRFLSVLLWGQPQFERQLMDERFSEIQQRLTIHKMPRISEMGAAYLNSRLTAAGSSLSTLFSDAAVALLTAHYTTPLSIGNAAAAALLVAYQRGESRVIPDFVPVPNDPDSRMRKPIPIKQTA